MKLKRVHLGIEGWLLIVGILTLIFTGLMWYRQNYAIGVTDADTFTATFSANGNPEARLQTKVHWAKGDIVYGVNQKYGTPVTTKYDIFSGETLEVGLQNGLMDM